MDDVLGSKARGKKVAPGMKQASSWLTSFSIGMVLIHLIVKVLG